jgi:hypothetical protein
MNPVSPCRRFLYATSFGIAFLCLSAASPKVAPLAAQGASDIYVVRVSPAGDRLAPGTVSRVTNRDVYNNQPAFLRDGRLVYTSIAIAGPEGQADIWIAGKSPDENHPFTKTRAESEYSAYHMPGADRVAVIRVEADSTQRLWSFNRQGEDPQLVLTALKPIGYQAWVDATHVAVFVLGDAKTRAPASLQLVDLADERAVPIATGIGRALQSVPGRRAVSFTRRDSANVRWIDVYDVATKQITHAARTLPQNEYHVWMPNGLLVSAEGSKLYQMMPGKDTEWTLLADLADRGVKGITRLAVSPDGKQIALVAAH